MILLVAVNRLAQFLACACHIQNIILDLEGKTDIAGSLLDHLHGLFRCSGKDSSCHHGTLNKSRRFILVYIIQNFSVHRLSVILHIHTLAAQHSVDSGLIRHDPESFDHPVFFPGPVKGCEHYLIGIIQKRHAA